uniref:Reverse transcriptase/retrotransposon-derived protein RNase H-like domain-containing protein n=1 Tax=Cyprinus carpio TaxID=7962 RepID=A0A8C1X0R6_CYPCA
TRPWRARVLQSLGKTKPNDVLEWTDEHEHAFTDLKQRLCAAPTLGLPNPSNIFHIQVDAHEITLSGVLAQEHGGKLRPTAYYSQKNLWLNEELTHVHSRGLRCIGC